MSLLYILDKDGKPKKSDIKEWSKWWANSEANSEDRHIVMLDKLPSGEISTIFLSVDSSTSRTGPPILWETMVFGGKLDGEQRRYTSEAAAILGHKELVNRVRNEG